MIDKVEASTKPGHNGGWVPVLKHTWKGQVGALCRTSYSFPLEYLSRNDALERAERGAREANETGFIPPDFD